MEERKQEKEKGERKETKREKMGGWRQPEKERN